MLTISPCPDFWIFHKGDLERCKEYYRDAYALYRVTGNDRDRISLEKDAKEELGLEFPF